MYFIALPVPSLSLLFKVVTEQILLIIKRVMLFLKEILYGLDDVVMHYEILLSGEMFHKCVLLFLEE